MTSEEACCSGWKRPRVDYDETWANRDDGGEAGQSLLAKDMNGLTVEERMKVYDEIHGVEDITEETPEFVSTKLREMRAELAKIPKVKKRALNRAIFLRPELQQDDKLYLMFLRSDRFNAIDAANKLCRHFENKLLLFGDEALPRDITLDDLSEKEMECMYNGCCIFLPSKDQRGRAIRLISSLSHPPDWKAVVRYNWYQVMVALEDEDVQKNGIVNVANLCEKRRHPLPQMIETLKKCSPYLTDWPLRTCGFHICYDKHFLRSFLQIIQFVMGKEFRLRERLHFGSELEARYSLLSFGIVIPQSFQLGRGYRSREHIDSYLADRRRKEGSRKAELEASMLASRDNLIPYPNPSDVLLGRKRTWVGNDKYTELISSLSERYKDSSERLGKTVVAMEILQRVHLNGGRFLQREDRGWKVIEDHIATEKICQALRVFNLRKKDLSITGKTPLRYNESKLRAMRDMPVSNDSAFDIQESPMKRPCVQKGLNDML